MPLFLWLLPALDIIHYHLPAPPIITYDVFVALFLPVIVNKLGFYKFIGYMSKKESHILLQLSPIAAILLFRLSRHYLTGRPWLGWKWKSYVLIPLWFIIYILARFGSPGDHCRFHKVVKVASKASLTIVLATAFKLISMFNEPEGLMVLLSPLLLDNLQIPMALARIFLARKWLFNNEVDVYDSDNGNIEIAVKLLYIMVFVQGLLYMAACILESFSFLPRRSLALGWELVDKMGMESVNIYYEQAYDTFLQESLFDTTKKMGLVTFAVNSLNSSASWEKKRAAVRILDSFLQRHETTSSSNTELVSLITTSTKAVTTLISMLGWTNPEDADIRMFATKVTAHLAPYRRIVGIPGTMQMVSSLLDAQDEPMKEDLTPDNQQMNNGSNSPRDIEGGTEPTGQASSTQAQRKCCLVEWIRRFLPYVRELRSLPREVSKDRDSLPALGMQILERLAHDLHNCAEINRAIEILPKVVEYISCITGTTAAVQEKIGTASMRLISKLASIKGEIGITLRHELSENPFLIGNLAEILELEVSSSHLQQSELAMDIIAKLAVDKKTRQKIGRIQVIIDKLVRDFFGGDESPKPLRAAAGEALAMLAMESPGNCSAMLMDEPNYELIEDLAKKVQHGQHIYTAASLLRSLCENCRQVFCHQGPSDHLYSTLTVVIGEIINAEGKQMEALIGLASLICSVISERIAPVLESFQDGEAFAEKLVEELNAHKKPTPHESPNTRMLLVGLTVSVVEFCPRYAPIFREHGMVEALSKVEKYMVLFSSAGVVSEEPGGLRTLVARAKLLISSNTT